MKKSKKKAAPAISFEKERADPPKVTENENLKGLKKRAKRDLESEDESSENEEGSSYSEKNKRRKVDGAAITAKKVLKRTSSREEN